MSRLLSLLVFALVFATNFTTAQDGNEITGHVMRGTVVKGDSSPVPDAMVEVRSVQSGAAQSIVYTNGSGVFQLRGVTPGQYVITVTDGAKSTQQQISFSGFEPDIRISVAGPGPAANPSSKQSTVSIADLKTPEKAKRAVESARNALSKNKIEEALGNLQRALTISPGYPEALSLRAVVFLAKGDVHGALQDAQHSVEIDPGNSLAYTILGASYNAAEQFVQALDSLQQALKLDPNFWQAHYELAKTFYSQGRAPSALHEVDTAQKNAPKDFAAIHLMRGAILIRLQRTTEAAEELQEFLKQDPKNPQAASVERTLASISQPGAKPPQNVIP